MFKVLTGSAKAVEAELNELADQYHVVRIIGTTAAATTLVTIVKVADEKVAYEYEEPAEGEFA